MGRRKRDKVEFRFYEIPHGESALALLGEAWVGAYGRGEVCLHFHNLFEIGYCHYGHGILILGEDEKPYEDAMISAIPANFCISGESTLLKNLLFMILCFLFLFCFPI